ncbi:MAG: DUF1573 domain-containing protein [Alphaproteobacteria bacterium]|nr:MAG: DUF1573 domain-containing protein [Alphaproteobacteria bacterium]
MLVRTIFLTLALLSGMGTAKAEIAAPKAIAEQQYWDFGRVESGTPLEHLFSLRNTGSAPLRIENVQLSGKGLKIRVPRSIPPGKTANVIAYIDTRSVIGLWKWRILLQTNDKTKRVVSYNIRAFVYSPLEVDPLERFQFTPVHILQR